MAKTKSNGKKQPLRVGSRIRFPYGVGEVEAVVIEDRGNLGIGGRQIVRVRILGRGNSPEAGDPPMLPSDMDEGGFELPAEELTLVEALQSQVCSGET